jgi:uncharacterized membrane protein
VAKIQPSAFHQARTPNLGDCRREGWRFTLELDRNTSDVKRRDGFVGITLLRACVPIALLCGLFFRFYHIDRKVFWDDEIYSAMRIVGESEEDAIRQAAAAHTATDLQKILHPGPLERDPSLQGTVDGLIHEEPQHPPVYFALAHLWSDRFGNSVRVLRLFSAIVGVLAIPAMFWLCLELFGSQRAGWIGAALIATSPIAVLYSQEIRDYSSWALTLLVMGASLLRALRLQTIRAWALYAAALAFGLYVYVLSIVTALGFAVVVALDGWKRHGTKPYALISFGAGFLLFSPWLFILAGGMDAVHRGTATILSQRLGSAYILEKLVASLRLNFFDYNLQSTTLNLLLSIPVLLLVGYALYFCRTLPLRTWAFIYTMLVFTTVPLVVHDLLFGGILTVQTRYFIPAFLACDLALVGLFDSALSRTAGRGARVSAWSAIFVLVLVGRVSSCAVSAQATSWWTTFDERSIAIARTINASSNPLFVSDNYIGYVLSVAEYLRPNVAVHIRSVCYLCVTKEPEQIGSRVDHQLAGSSDVYLLGPSPALQARVQTALVRLERHTRYWCIDVRANCASPLRLWRWVQ